MKKIIVASTNKHKIQEIIKIINELNFSTIEVQSIGDANIAEPDEPYDDFIKNATHKAQYYGRATQEITLADDSGLCIEALNGFPGVKTKDFLEECGGLENTFTRLEQMLSRAANYRACFRSAIVLFFPHSGQLIAHEDKHFGTLTFPPRGAQGFGFDPIFIPEGFNQTMAELGTTVKNQISHRAKALRGMMQKLKEIEAVVF